MRLVLLMEFSCVKYLIRILATINVSPLTTLIYGVCQIEIKNEPVTPNFLVRRWLNQCFQCQGEVIVAYRQLAEVSVKVRCLLPPIASQVVLIKMGRRNILSGKTRNGRGKHLRQSERRE